MEIIVKQALRPLLSLLERRARSEIKNIIGNKTLLVSLVIFLFLVSTVQSIFLIKLYRSVNQDSPVEIPRGLGKNFDLPEDFFKRFDDQNYDATAMYGPGMSDRVDELSQIILNHIHVRNAVFDIIP